MGIVMQNDAAEVKIRAERCGGQLLVDMKANGQRHSGSGDHKAKSRDVTSKLADLGIAKIQSQRWQQIAGNRAYQW